MADSKASTRLKAVLAAAVVAVLGVGLWFVMRPELHLEDGPKRLTADEVTQLVELKNRAVGYLENGRFDECDGLFQQLTEKLPGERLGPRNLTIARLLAIGQFHPVRNADDHALAIENARRALAGLRDVEGQTTVVHLLTARLAQESKEEKQAVEELTRATDLSPDDPTVWFALYLAGRYSRDAATKKIAHNALGRAYTLDSDNLFVLMRWLVAQAQANDPEVTATIVQAEALLMPLAAGIRERIKIDVLELLSAARRAAEQNDFATVFGQLSRISNVTIPEDAAKIDQRRIKPHLAEFALDDFTPAFYEAASTVRRSDDEPIHVKFASRPFDGPLGQLNDIRDAVLADFDLDERLDVCLLRETTVEIYTRPDKSEGWKLLVSADVPAGMQHLVVADLDSDFDENRSLFGDPNGARKAGPRPKESSNVNSRKRKPDSIVCTGADDDLIVYGAGGIRFFENKRDISGGQRRLSDIKVGDEIQALRKIRTAAVVDLDSDGDLDLVLSTAGGLSLWSNRGNKTFENISARSALPPDDLMATAVLAVDWDRDVDIDVLLAGASGVVGVLENLRHGELRWRAFEQNSKITTSAVALEIVDVDANASWDFLIAGKEGISLARTHRPGMGGAEPIPPQTVSEFPAARLLTWDYDNDGLDDLLAWNSSEVRLLRGESDGRFEEMPNLLDATPKSITACDVGDVDSDGDLDLIVVDAGRLVLFSNDGGNANGWIDVTLRALQMKDSSSPSESGRVNADGIGSLLELKAGTRYQPKIVRRQRTHFGIGRRQRADVVRVLWTNGIPHNIIEPAARLWICEKQTPKGSCPYLYAWNGTAYEFVTDLLWASPIGLQWAAGVLAPAREWEYLKIPGDRLKPVEGEYRLQVTEELWEAAYFDHVKLLAVDHPSDVAVYSNEKVGPAEIAGFQIHTVRNPKAPVAAHNHRGRNILPEIATRDGVYLKAFDRKYRQGLVEEHYLELDFGKLDNPKKITLFLTGWVYPTDTSINVALSQNPEMKSPRPPSLWVPDAAADGGWREAVSYIGFPGGKTKTIAVDLSGVFPAEDYRVRIATSMELYWDAVFFTVDEEPVVLKILDCELTSADLHFRGYSEIVTQPGFGPDRYDYQHVSTAPRWPPMDGRFTRFGNVTELIRRPDDRLVVMGAGDEMTLRFKVPADAPPAGWTRDFILHNVGWDKDADLNTVYGRTVEPLPFRSMSRYPFPPGESPPENGRYRTYLETYQTRRQNSLRFWTQIRDFRAGDSSVRGDK